MSNGLSGSTPLGYQGTNAATPPNVTMHKNAPTPNNYQNFSIGDFWIQIVDPRANTNLIYVLLGVVANVADWVLLSGSVGPLISLTGDSGGAVFASGGNINIQGAGGIVVSGDPLTNTLTINSGNPGAGSISILGAAPGSLYSLNDTGALRWICPSASGPSSTQNVVQFAVPVAGTLSELYVNVGSNASTTNCTITVNKNGSNTAMVATITALTTGSFTDLTHSIAFAAGDLLQFELQQSTTGDISGSISVVFTT